MSLVSSKTHRECLSQTQKEAKFCREHSREQFLLPSSRKEIYLADKPKFECGHKKTVALNKRDFEIRCPVRADPPIDNLNFYWATGSDNETLKGGESEGHYKAQVEPVVGTSKVGLFLQQWIWQQRDPDNLLLPLNLHRIVVWPSFVEPQKMIMTKRQ